MIADDAPPVAAPAHNDRDWDAIERSPDFRELVAAKWRFILPASAFFLIYYFALPVLSGYAPGLMATPVIGPVNLANLFALSQFVMVAVVMTLYVKRAAAYDDQAAAVVAKLDRPKR